jgi:AmpD protein
MKNFPLKTLNSPFFNDRPDGALVDLLVIHSMSLPEGEYGKGNIEKLFLGTLSPAEHPSFESLKDVKVSAHVVIDRAGRMTQFVPFDKRAWHAGISSFQGRENCNDYSIGVELEGTDHTPFTEAQYESLNALIEKLQTIYPGMTRDRIVGHSDIAPGRKKDPGIGFDWAKVKAQ